MCFCKNAPEKHPSVSKHSDYLQSWDGQSYQSCLRDPPSINMKFLTDLQKKWGCLQDQVMCRPLDPGQDWIWLWQLLRLRNPKPYTEPEIHQFTQGCQAAEQPVLLLSSFILCELTSHHWHGMSPVRTRETLTNYVLMRLLLTSRKGIRDVVESALSKSRAIWVKF